jgi:hypothetical protein
MSTLALTSNTLAVTAGAGQIEYNGQFFATDSNASRGQLERITQGTAVASTSGTSIDFTGIPAWAKKITVMFNGVSTSGTSPKLVQLGSTTISTTGYLSSGLTASSAGTLVTSSTAGMLINSVLAAEILSGTMILSNVSGNTWVSSANGKSSTLNVFTTGGDITLGGTLDRIRITTVNGTDTFDAGSINIMYEG